MVVAHALHDRDFAIVVQPLHAGHRLLPAEVGIDLQHVFLFDADRRPMLVVHRIAVRHDRVQPVVSAEPFEDDQDLPRVGCGGDLACFTEHIRHWTEAAEQTKPEPAGAKPHQVAT